MSLNPCTLNIPNTRTDLENALNSVVDGDVICLAAGDTSTFNVAVFILKGIEIRGHGTMPSDWGSAGETIIRIRTPQYTPVLQIVNTTSTSAKISNIRFIIDSSSTELAYVLFNERSTKPSLIHHNDFQVDAQTGGGGNVCIQAYRYNAVIYRNKFTANALQWPGGFTNLIGVHPLYEGDAGGNWESASTWGSSDTNGEINGYLETNYFTGFLINDVNHAARFVTRFNEFHNAAIGGHGFDSGSDRGSSGLRFEENYNNIFYCDATTGGPVPLTNWISIRGGSGKVFNNTFPAWNGTYCGPGSGGLPALQLDYYKSIQYQDIWGWPGSSPDTYPAAHQPGWGWISGSNQSVGGTSAQGIPYDGAFQQALEPFYLFNNTNNTGFANPVVGGFGLDGRVVGYSNSSKTVGTTLTVSGYATANGAQTLFVAFTDLIGGTAPAISDSQSGSWTAVNGGSSGGMRLSGWWRRVTTTGLITVTITHDNVAAARAVVLGVIRSLDASPVDKNPTVATIPVSTNSNYASNPTTALTNTNEIVVGYFALNGPTVKDANSPTYSNDVITLASGWTKAQINGRYQDNGITGTTGGAANTNVSIAMIWQAISNGADTTATITNASQRLGLAGIVSFKITGNLVGNLDLKANELIQANREYYADAGLWSANAGFASHAHTSGTVTGTAAEKNAITTCTQGVGFWVTDEGSWNTENTTSGAWGFGKGQGQLYRCNASNSFDLYYTPYRYPHILTETVDEAPIEPPVTPGPHSVLITLG